MADAKLARSRAKSGGAAAGSLIPYRQYNYRITIAEGGIIGHFTRCEGIQVATDRLGSHYLPLTLYHGVISNDSLGLWSWMENTRKHQRDKRSVMLDHLGPEPDHLYSYVLEQAWIMGWRGGKMDALGREYAVERISIAYDAVSRGKG